MKRETRKKVRELVKKWKQKLHLTQWRFTMEFYSNPHPDDSGDEVGTVMAQSEINSEYMFATLRFFPSVEESDEEAMERCVVHELLHCITHPSRTAAKRLLRGELVTDREIEDLNENMTTLLERVLVDG